MGMINTNTDLSSSATVTIREIYKETIAHYTLPSNTIISAVEASPALRGLRHSYKN